MVEEEGHVLCDASDLAVPLLLHLETKHGARLRLGEGEALKRLLALIYNL